VLSVILMMDVICHVCDMTEQMTQKLQLVSHCLM